MRPLVIYHANCADGFAAAYAAYLALGKDCDYVPMAYGDIEYNPQDRCFVVGKESHCIIDRDVYVLDFSFPTLIIEDLLAHTSRFVWLDHHKTAFENYLGKIPEGGVYAPVESLREADTICLDMHQSGAMLSWVFFHDGAIPLFIQHIDDYDRWQFKLENTKTFMKGLWSHAPWSFEQWSAGGFCYVAVEDLDKLPEGMEMSDDHYSLVIFEGEAILRAHEQNVAAVSDKPDIVCMPCGNMGTVCPVASGLAVNAPAHLASDVGHALAAKSGTFGLVWHMAGGRVKCSLRSEGDYDVSAIAKYYGGGGHRNAAGFEVGIEVLQGWLSGRA